MHAESTPPQQQQQQLSRTEEKYQQKKIMKLWQWFLPHLLEGMVFKRLPLLLLLLLLSFCCWWCWLKLSVYIACQWFLPYSSKWLFGSSDCDSFIVMFNSNLWIRVQSNFTRFFGKTFFPFRNWEFHEFGSNFVKSFLLLKASKCIYIVTTS